VSSGYNITAPEVEAVLEQHPDVLECAVIGVPDAERGMIVHAAVVLRPDTPHDAEQIHRLQDFVKSTAAPYKYPRSMEFIDALPRNPSGKLQRYKLRERWNTSTRKG
ncbi:AMP-binding enzyme, partial [Nocardia gipuzkoensis]